MAKVPQTLQENQHDASPADVNQSNTDPAQNRSGSDETNIPVDGNTVLNKAPIIYGRSDKYKCSYDGKPATTIKTEGITEIACYGFSNDIKTLFGEGKAAEKIKMGFYQAGFDGIGLVDINQEVPPNYFATALKAAANVVREHNRENPETTPPVTFPNIILVLPEYGPESNTPENSRETPPVESPPSL